MKLSPKFILAFVLLMLSFSESGNAMNFSTCIFSDSPCQLSELYSDSNFHFMTSKGYLFLNSDQVKSILLEGQKEAAKKELGKGIRADELLAGEVISVSWKKGICHMTAEKHRERDFS